MRSNSSSRDLNEVKCGFFRFIRSSTIGRLQRKVNENKKNKKQKEKVKVKIKIIKKNIKKENNYIRFSLNWVYTWTHVGRTL